jgi:cyclopropane-fatty-acyl-phospholipid synthase
VQWVLRQLYLVFFSRINDISAALQNVVAHYDISNGHFASFLSPDMSYSCPIWSKPDESLEKAQIRKVENVIQQARVQPTDHVLDIGGGWGALAIETVKRTGCRFTVVTLSANQKEWAEKRIRQEGLTDKIQYLLCDYRQIPSVPGGYDKVVSIEMLEHVGRKHLPNFFAVINRLLNPNTGRIVIQGITVINEV